MAHDGDIARLRAWTGAARGRLAAPRPADHGPLTRGSAKG